MLESRVLRDRDPARDNRAIVSKHRTRAASDPCNSHAYRLHQHAGDNRTVVDERRYARSTKHVSVPLFGDCDTGHTFLGVTVYEYKVQSGLKNYFK